MRFKFALIVLFFLFSVSMQAQLERLTEKIKEKVDERIERKIDEKIEKTLDETEKGIEEGNKKDTKAKTKKAKAVKEEKAEDEEEADAENQEAEKETPKKKSAPTQSKSKFDFIPGEKIIFFDDLNDVAIGDFPENWDTESSAETVTLENAPGKWLKMKGDYSYFSPVIKSLKMPENFTIEFDAVNPGGQGFSLEIYENPNMKIDDNYYPGKGGTFIGFEETQMIWKTWKEGEEGYSEGDSPYEVSDLNAPLHFSIWGQKSRLRVYCGTEKVLDVPRGIRTDLKLNYLRFGNYPNEFMYVSNLRVAVGAPDMRNRLIKEGKFVTNGITFDSGSDKIKPESHAVLKEIADVLKENASVKVKIVGHTDSDGNDASNLTLSKKRAESVKNALSSQFGIDASRMTTDGKGEAEPVAKNDNKEGKAINRRVEFIKM